MIPSIKILIVTHKPSIFPKHEAFVPIHAGRSIALKNSKDGKLGKKSLKWLIKNTIGDNSGDNISEKNRFYSELSAVYWAWKNYDKLGNPDYIGFMHYRRHFMFNFEENQKKQWDLREKAYANKYINSLETHLKENTQQIDDILEILKKYDGIITHQSDLSLLGIQSVYEDYKKNISGVQIKDFDLLINHIESNYPQYKEHAQNLKKKHHKHMYQMFILPKEEFFNYAKFLFEILFELEKKIDLDTYTQNGKRTLGYLGENIYDIYFSYQKDVLNKKYQELPVYFFKSEDKKNTHFLNLLFHKISYKLSFGRQRKNKKEYYHSLKNLKREKKLEQKNGFK